MARRPRDERVKQETLAAYGGQCACCGEDEPAFLTVDHIYGDGALERAGLSRDGKGRAGGVPFYRWLRRQGFPQGRYQVLCANCNKAKHELGVCPHAVDDWWEFETY